LLVGSVIGSFLGGYLTEYLHPQWSFLFYSFFSIFVFMCASALSKEIDEKGIEDMKGLKSEFKRSWIEIKKIKDFPEIYNTILFILLNWFLFSPSFSEFFQYYNMNVRKLKQD